MMSVWNTQDVETANGKRKQRSGVVKIYHLFHRSGEYPGSKAKAERIESDNPKQLQDPWSSGISVEWRGTSADTV